MTQLDTSQVWAKQQRLHKVQELPETGRVMLHLDAKARLFYGKRAHEVEPYCGERYSVASSVLPGPTFPHSLPFLAGNNPHGAAFPFKSVSVNAN